MAQNGESRGLSRRPSKSARKALRLAPSSTARATAVLPCTHAALSNVSWPISISRTPRMLWNAVTAPSGRTVRSAGSPGPETVIRVPNTSPDPYRESWTRRGPAQPARVLRDSSTSERPAARAASRHSLARAPAPHSMSPIVLSR